MYNLFAEFLWAAESKSELGAESIRMGDPCEASSNFAGDLPFAIRIRRGTADPSCPWPCETNCEIVEIRADDPITQRPPANRLRRPSQRSSLRASGPSTTKHPPKHNPARHARWVGAQRAAPARLNRPAKYGQESQSTPANSGPRHAAALDQLERSSSPPSQTTAISPGCSISTVVCSRASSASSTRTARSKVIPKYSLRSSRDTCDS